jgi:hypothetical protein
MGTRPLVIRVEEIATGGAWVYVFDSGPVWIGCTASASLPIARPFILEQHGILQFDERSVRYQDLDARSGTSIDGVPAGSGENPVTEWSRIEMGPVRLTVSRKLPEEPASDPRGSPFAATAPATLVLPPRSDLPVAPVPLAPAWDAPPRPSAPPSNALLQSDEFDEALPSRRTSERAPTESKAKKTKRKRRVRRRFSFLAWVAAFALFVGIVGVAGLMLQFKGVPWMPPELAARIPAWLAAPFR